MLLMWIASKPLRRPATVVWPDSSALPPHIYYYSCTLLYHTIPPDVLTLRYYHRDDSMEYSDRMLFTQLPPSRAQDLTYTDLPFTYILLRFHMQGIPRQHRQLPRPNPLHSSPTPKPLVRVACVLVGRIVNVCTRMPCRSPQALPLTHPTLSHHRIVCLIMLHVTL
jgi:hypothetical protein